MSQQDYDVIIIGAGLPARHGQPRRGTGQARRRAGEEHGRKIHLQLTLCLRHFHINFTGLDAPEDMLRPRSTPRPMASREGPGPRRRQGRPPADAMLKGEGIDIVNLGGYGTNVLSPPWRTGYGLTWQNYGADIALQRLEANLLKRQGGFCAAPARRR
jgi:hypothetical protein